MTPQRGRFVMRGGELVPIDQAEPLFPVGPASDLARPMIISDTMAPTRCMADGRVYTSKRAMSATHRSMGMIEVGNEKLPAKQRPRASRREIKGTIERAEARFNRGERAKKR